MNRAEQESTARIHLDELRGLLGVMAPSEQQPITARTSIAEVEAELARERAVTLSEPVRITSAPPANEDWDEMPGTTVKPRLPSAHVAALLPATPRAMHGRTKHQTERGPNREARARLATVDEGPTKREVDRRPEPAMCEAVAMLPLQPPPFEADVPSMPQPRHLDVQAAVEPPTGSLRYAELAAYFVISCFVGLCGVYCLA